MKVSLVALLAGTLFGFGLAVSEMIDPARVIGFLDVAGGWDPTLLFVMGGALAVTVPAFPLVLGRPRPLLAARFALPAPGDVDARLLGGATLFGIGWGIGGLCPGPALAGLATFSPGVAAFVAAMLAGQWLAARAQARFAKSVPPA